MNPSVEQFISHLLQAFADSTLVKCSLSRPRPQAQEGLKNVYIRPVSLKKGMHLACNYRFQTRDELKNYSAEEGSEVLKHLLTASFFNAELFCTDADYSLQSDKNGNAKLQRKKPTHTQPPEAVHDRIKQRRLDPSAPWLHALGITNAKGEVLAAAQDKWRQINKYLEIIESLLRAKPLPEDAFIADMGSGKGYLTFALYDFLTHAQGIKPQITGIELRPNLVDLCNKIARDNHFSGLHFEALDIKDYQPGRLDMLIALHACDTATDLALSTGIVQKAGIIVAAPCCHKQIRKDMETQNEMAPLLRFGILEERQAEILTDGIRALMLESRGYETKVFEFISSEHTAKNVMITAIGGKKPDKLALEKIQEIKKGFGIKQHFLEKLLDKQ